MCKFTDTVTNFYAAEGFKLETVVKVHSDLNTAYPYGYEWGIVLDHDERGIVSWAATRQEFSGRVRLKAFYLFRDDGDIKRLEAALMGTYDNIDYISPILDKFKAIKQIVG